MDDYRNNNAVSDSRKYVLGNYLWNDAMSVCKALNRITIDSKLGYL